MSLTMILLTASVGCNLWFLFLLLYDRIMETKLIRFFRNLAGLWQALDNTAEKQEAEKEAPAEEMPDIIGKSRFKMTPTRTTAATPVPHAATSEKGMELSEEEATFDDGNAETASRPAQVPEEKLDETFTSIQPSDWSSERTSRKRTIRICHGLRAAVLTRLTRRSRQPRTRKRPRKNVSRRQRCLPKWKARSCTTN